MRESRILFVVFAIVLFTLPTVGTVATPPGDQAPAAPEQPAYVPGEVLIGFNADARPSDIDAALRILKRAGRESSVQSGDEVAGRRTAKKRVAPKSA